MNRIDNKKHRLWRVFFVMPAIGLGNPVAEKGLSPTGTM